MYGKWWLGGLEALAGCWPGGLLPGHQVSRPPNQNKHNNKHLVISLPNCRPPQTNVV
jgi:hypothetical protein